MVIHRSVFNFFKGVSATFFEATGFIFGFAFGIESENILCTIISPSLEFKWPYCPWLRLVAVLFGLGGC